VDKEKLFRQMEDRSLALDSSGHPHIAYGEEGVFYAWHDGSAWHLETADSSPGVGRFATLGLDAFDHPHIAYYDEIAEDLRYAHHDGSAWHTEVVDPGIGNC
jgi:hypothetical protein